MKYISNSSLIYSPASHENPLNPGVLKKILLSHADGIEGKIQMINWAKLLPHKFFNKHAHIDMREIFILMDGEAIATVDQQIVYMQKGDLLIVDPMEEHMMKNETDNTVSFIAIGIA